MRWQVGSKLEVWSNSKKEWCDGEITKKFKQNGDEYFKISFDDGKLEKDCLRMGNELRVRDEDVRERIYPRRCYYAPPRKQLAQPRHWCNGGRAPRKEIRRNADGGFGYTRLKEHYARMYR